ncbi:MAG: UDP-N-acetylmuramate:L-alanyl-gamma-D-glutamyl-meso-diaminopimelate ligase [Burkholderiales bacterium]|jgi:UDP-N-acetylmuramate: L-alanyl-gamma-D-glutamyl-meso-diaminopimelate ligase|nr:UDP-N-acetylmuramate:L-alanyl-gamma-D-glutamyl-meso-diaminopimelate ligase [Burkholderiales bacterium]
MHLHILGICGTFMGGIAALAQQQGHTVTGCDAQTYPPMSSQLEALGITLTTGYEAEQLDTVARDVDIFVIGNALSRGNSLVEAILERNLPYTSGPQWLAEHVLRATRPRHVLAVAGTHGKTTTASMLAWILESAGLHPGFLIGGVPAGFQVSARLTDSPYFVIEADEYDTAFFDKRSKFVHYRPRTAILNNLEFDHADIFADLASIETQFHHLVRTVPPSGRLIVNAESEALQRVLARGAWSSVEHFGGGEVKSSPEWRLIASGSFFKESVLPSLSPCPSPAESGRGEAFPSSLPCGREVGREGREILIGEGAALRRQSRSSHCASPSPLFKGGAAEGGGGLLLQQSGREVIITPENAHKPLSLPQPGTMNAMNALAALAAAHHVGVGVDEALAALACFPGVARRLELRGRVRGVTVYDDFAHHPTAIAATLEALRSRIGNARLLAVLEPRSNTMKLGTMKATLPDSLRHADAVYCYAANLGWDAAAALTPLGEKARTFDTIPALLNALTADTQAGDHVLIMSNGSFGEIHQKLLAALSSFEGDGATPVVSF